MTAARSIRAPFVPRGLVVADGFDWGGDRPPAIPYSDTIIYETHVKGFSQRHPGVPKALRGTYAGLVAPGPPWSTWRRWE